MFGRLHPAVIPAQRHAVYFHKAYIFGQIEAMSARSDTIEKAFRYIAAPLCSEIFYSFTPAVSLSYPYQNGELNFFSQAIRKRAGTCPIKYATGCTCSRHAATKIISKENSNQFKISPPGVKNRCACAREPIGFLHLAHSSKVPCVCVRRGAPANESTRSSKPATHDQETQGLRGHL